MKTRIALLFILLLATACASAPAATSLQPTPTSAAAASPDAVLIDAKCPINPAQAAEVAARLPRIYTQGQCGLHFLPGNNGLLTGVLIVYPEGWIVSLVNTDGTALLFELGGRVLFFQAFQSDLPLERADQVTYSTELSPAEPAVNPEEIVKDRMQQDIGDKQVLVLTTTMSEQTIRRYFLSRSAAGMSNTIYMFQFTVLAPNLDNSDLIVLIEGLIGSLKFDQ